MFRWDILREKRSESIMGAYAIRLHAKKIQRMTKYALTWNILRDIYQRFRTEHD